MTEIVKAYIIAIVKRGAENKVAMKIREMKEVTEVLVTYSFWETIAHIEAENLGHLDKIITDIRQITEIEQTRTLIGP